MNLVSLDPFKSSAKTSQKSNWRRKPEPRDRDRLNKRDKGRQTTAHSVRQPFICSNCWSQFSANHDVRPAPINRRHGAR